MELIHVNFDVACKIMCLNSANEEGGSEEVVAFLSRNRVIYA